MYILENLQPKKVFKFFEEISRIPRGSGNELEVAKYIENFAKERGLWVIRDDFHNVIIKKDATAGYENSPVVMLQGHIDMVCEKNAGTVHDFEKDPIKLVIDGEFLRADGTTLGADNAVAVAYAMAILDSNNLNHPALEVLLTADEEQGMSGAINVDGSLFKATRMINLDSSPEGHFYAGCSGGMRQLITLNLTREAVPVDYSAYAIKVRGLNGGHSGNAIHLELANSNKIIGRAFQTISKITDMRILEIFGGLKENAIPREADSIIFMPKSDQKDVENDIKTLENVLKKEFRLSDNGVFVIFEEINCDKNLAFDKASTKKIMQALNIIPSGLLHKSLEIQGLTETSTNLGVVETDGDKVILTSASRSSVASRKEYMKQVFASIAEALDAEILVRNEYPAWEFNPNSELRDIAMATYKEMFGKEPKLTATHGGLECGLLLEKIPSIDIVAFAPTMIGIHTPEEKLDIASTERVYNLLVKVLEKLR